MRIAAFLLAAAGTLGLTGCADLLTLNSFVSDEQAVSEPALTGLWGAPSDNDQILIRQKGVGYEICFKPGTKDAIGFSGRLMKVNEALILDMYPTKEEPFQLRTHMLVRVWPEGATLRWAFLESGWLKQQVKQQLATAPDGDLVVEPGNRVHDFIAKVGEDTRAYDDVQVLSKVQ